MQEELTKAEKRALRAAAQLAYLADRSMPEEDRRVHYLETGISDLPLLIGNAVANGVIHLEDVGEAARDRVSRAAEVLRAIGEDSKRRRRVVVEPGSEWFDPRAVVPIAAIVRELDFLGPEDSLYIHRGTGEVRIHSHDEDLEELDEESPADDVTDEAGGTPEEKEWIALLSQSDLDDRDMMRRFARRAAPAASRDLEEALFSGRGSYRRFRDVLHHRGLEKEWESYRHERLTAAVEFHLETAQIRFRK